MPNESQFDQDYEDNFGDINDEPSDQEYHDDNPEPAKSRRTSKLTKTQKLAMASLGIFAVLTVILWSVQLKNSIYQPLNSGQSAGSEPPIDGEIMSDLALKNKDTDADGLNDYDELNLFKTSPYLEDSDSDSLKDGDEIQNGSDPNCPQGRTCFSGTPAAQSGQEPATQGGADNAAGASGALNNFLNQYNSGGQASGQNTGGDANLSDEQKEALRNIDVASLRQMLLDAGMQKDVLDRISDQELIQNFAETLSGQGE